MFKVILVGVLICGFMMVFMTTLQRHKEKLLHTAMDARVATLNTKVMLINSQWRLDGKPDVISLSTSMEAGKGEHVTYTVNQYGWPDIVLPHNACARLWKKLLEVDLKVLNTPLAPIELKLPKRMNARVCRYHLNSDSFIEYNTKNGKISNKN